MKHLAVLMTLGLLLMAGPTKAQKVPEAPYGLSAVDVYSYFNSSFQIKDFETSLMYGRWLLVAHPKEMKNFAQYRADRVHERMVDVYESFAKKQQDPSIKSAYLDSTLQIFDLAFSRFSKEEIDYFQWTFKRGRFYQLHLDFIEGGIAKAYEDYMAIFAMDPQKTTDLAKGYYVKIVLQNLVAKGDKDAALAMIEKVTPIANDDMLEYTDKLLNQLFSTPAERITFLEGKLEADKENLTLLTELYELYLKTDDTAKSRTMAQRLYQLQPNLKHTMYMAEIAMKNANDQQAIRYYREAIDKAEDKETKHDLSLKTADIYLNQGDLVQAREMARKALSYVSGSGAANIKIATIYAQAVTKCGAGQMTRQDKVVYWLVLDYLDKAKSDASVTNQVNNLYRSYQPVTPSVDEKFFMSWNAGDKLKVDTSLKECYNWIGETTTVR